MLENSFPAIKRKKFHPKFFFCLFVFKDKKLRFRLDHTEKHRQHVQHRYNSTSEYFSTKRSTLGLLRLQGSVLIFPQLYQYENKNFCQV